jgi:sugar (pentulose or hexulose) kinase
MKNPDWVTIVADVLGRPLQVSGVEEASARGAAVLVLERLGEMPEPAPVAEEVRPREDRTRIYRTARRRQRALYDAVTGAPLRST